jgi:hypothetical protein
MKNSYTIVAVNIDGDIVREYKNMREAADDTEMPANTLYYRSRRCMPSPDGLLYIRKDKIEELLSKHDMYEFFEGVRLDYIEHTNKNMRRSKVHHFVPYETQHNVICITPCPFISDYDGEERPKIGSSKCVKCRFFANKDSNKKIVECSFNRSGLKGIIYNKPQSCI